MKSAKRIIQFFALGILCTTAYAQDKVIGLALSGGGARAMAHVGVLQILDSAGLQVHYIAGTSMGAVIGAFYAMGYSGHQIEALMKKVDWQAISDNKVARNKLSFFDKRNSDRYLFSLPITEKGITIPPGINYGHYIFQTLARLTLSFQGYQDFRKLPIPFVCTGTDIENGLLVEFEEGVFSDILRATTAFPSVFSPYEIDGRLYVDGGVMDNLPIALLKKRNLQFIIASDVQNPAYSKEELTSISKILEQAATFANIKAYQDNICEVDLLIQPKIEEAGLLTFDLMDRLIQEGRKHALQYWDILVALAKKYPRTIPYQSQLPASEIFVKTIKISGTSDFDTEYIESALGMKKKTKISFAQINKFVDQLYGQKNHEIIKYDLYPATDTSYALNFLFRPFKYNQYLRIGLHFDTDFGSAFLFSYYRKNMIFRNSFFNLDLILGDNPRGELIYVVDRGIIPTLGICGRFNTFSTSIFQNETPVNFVSYRDFSADVFVQSIPAKSISISGGIQTEFFNIVPNLPIDPLIRDNLLYLNYFGNIYFDNLNQFFKPQRGSLFDVSVRVLSRTERFRLYIKPTTVVSGIYKQAFGYGRVGLNTTFQSLLSFGTTQFFPYKVFMGSLGQNYIQHIVPFAGYKYMELSGRQSAIFRADFFVKTTPNQFITFTYNIGKIGEEVVDLIDNPILDGFALSYGFNSIIGPIELSLMGNSKSSRVLGYLAVGYWF
ncbi:patatin-like phospholipase family protein [Schleiferia thermophila]|uniref:patatin-like phospholipase family protein n=1 Tax=Schleiferia thermophila TaxID=884107 RepID=UPI003EED8F14